MAKRIESVHIMNQFSEMEWNSKWDWENLVAFGSKAIESPKKLQLTDWTIVDDGEIDAGSFNLSAGGGNSGASGSDGGHVSSAKSSISASTTDSSTKDGIQTPNFKLMSFSGNFSDKTGAKGAEISRTSPQADADPSVGSLEPLIGLKLGKRTYFENSSAGANVKNAAIPVMPTPSNTLVKKTKSSGQNLPVPRCLVEGCNIDLSLAKEYHRKHRVCDVHSKCPKVIVGGVERRFCQQCSRFHSLSEFDEKKRSCRRRLSDHNARRRKPPQETVQFNSARLPSPFYEGRQQMGFLLNSAPYVYSRSPANNTWNGLCNSKFTITKGYSAKAEVDGTTDCLMQMPGMKLPHIINMQDNTNNGFLAPKSSVPEASSPGSKGSSMISSNVDAAPDYCRALSLLSSNSWGSESIPPVHQPLHENGGYITQTSMQQSALPEGVPLSPTDLWLTGHNNHQAAHPRPQPLAANSNFQEIQRLKTPYEADFYSNIL